MGPTTAMQNVPRESQAMDKHIIDRGGGRTLRLYSNAPREYIAFEGLPPVDSSSAHLRWHPLREEWIGYSSARQGRTFLPNQAECPLCAMTENGPVTDIPVDDYEIAIFTNRFSALSATPAPPPALGIETLAGKGYCDVVSYSSDHHASFANIGVSRIALLIEAIADRCAEIYQDPDICWALPFENRGREIGVTLDHPHGQIYALSQLPNAVQAQAQAFQKANPLADLKTDIPKNLVIAENQTGMAFCPEWARYPFEVWVAPYRQMAGPAAMTEDDRKGFAALMATVAGLLDGVFDAPMPYVMSWQIAPKTYEAEHHFHCVFQPLKRSRGKQKYLASVEQFTGFFLVDLPPERAADILNGKADADE